jgi:hypothetical protein
MGIGKRTFISRKKGKRFPFGFLLVEFPKEESIVRVRYRVIQYLYSGYGIQIRERGSEFTGHNRVSENRIEVGTYISSEKLFETLAKHISKEEKIPADSIAFRWENHSLKMPLETPPELDL